MSELSIKVTIADRTYPLTIKREEEEEIRKAAKMINDNVEELLSKYAVKDKQDLLAMTALQYSSELLNGKKNTVEDDGVIGKIQLIEQELSDYLKKV